MNDFQVIATLNTHLLEAETLKGMADRGATIFRINGSHIQPPELAHYAREVRNALGDRVKILVDLPGNKIRTGVLLNPIVIRAGKTFELLATQVNYAGFVPALKKGDILFANDSLFKFRVESTSQERAVLFSFTDGLLGSNKGIHLIGRNLDLPFLFERDRALIESARQNGLDYIGYSFVRTPADVEEAQALLKGTKLRSIIKMETSAAMENMDVIFPLADEFLVDRGDLSCDVGIENVDHFQKLVLRKGRKLGKRVYFATQFLFSMVENNVPLISEATSLSDVARLGVHGIQLSEETAIGKHPFEVLETVRRVVTVARAKNIGRTGAATAPVIWLTGLSGSGKTTIVREFMPKVEAAGLRACLIDGDEFRTFWGNDTGYTREDRFRNLRNIIFTAYQGSTSFDVVVVASLSPYREIRDLARERINDFHEIYVKAGIETCRQRDPKGHYGKAAIGEHKHFIGMTEEYEEPLNPELVLDTEKMNAAAAADQLWAYLCKAHS